MATGGIEVTSDEIFNFKCTACAKRNRNREAVKYCVECQRYCCQACVDAHNDFPALIIHNLLDKSSFKSVVLTTELPVVPTERCSDHETKILDMYCQDHDEVGCTTCMALDHRSCKDLHSIPDVIDTIFQKSDVEKTLQILKDNQKSIRTVKKIRDELLQELQKSKAEAVQALKDFRKEMARHLEEMEKQAINEVENEFGKMESTLTHDILTAAKEEDALQQSKNDLQKAEGNRAQVFVCMKIAQKKTESTEAIVRLLQTPTDAKVLFSANQEIMNFFQTCKSLGSVTNGRSGHASLKSSLYTIKRRRQFHIKTPTDSSPNTIHVYGTCVTEDGMLLLADHYNRKIKYVDIAKSAVVNHCDLPEKPWDVCCTSNQEVAVSLTNRTVQFVSLGNKMTTTRTMELNHECFGIAYKDDKLYITDLGRLLYIHDMTGKVMQAISMDSSGNEIFLGSRLIAFSDSGDRVFVACTEKGVVTLDMHGKYITSLNDQDLSCCYGVCTDHRGNIFVCGYRSNKIIQLTQDGTTVGTVVRDPGDLKRPTTVCFDPRQCSLIVTELGSSTVKIFDLQ